MRLAALLLVAWYVAHYSYYMFPVHAAEVFNVGRSASSLMLLAVIALALASRWSLPVLAGFAADDAQVVGCGIWWMVKPWETKGDLCSEAISLPLGAFGITCVGVIGAHILGKMKRANSNS
jgi:hypothetical protein